MNIVIPLDKRRCSFWENNNKYVKIIIINKNVNNDNDDDDDDDKSCHEREQHFLAPSKGAYSR